MNDFFVSSIEHRTYHAKHGCKVREAIDGNKLLVEINPPIPRWVYGKDFDLSWIVLAPRYADTTLVPQISELPCIVNMCLPKNVSEPVGAPWELLDIGELSSE
jgi:hypothetical protein